MKAVLITVGVLVLLALIVGGSVVGARNELVTERETVRTAFAQVDTVLQRRLDLIPNLVATVKGFAAQEKAVIDSVTNARAAMMGAGTNAEKIQASQQLDSALARLMVVVENYPQIKSNENFLALQDELANTENRIRVERGRYNEAVQKYNVAIEIFPKNLVASMFGFEREEFYRADAAAKDVPKVEF